MGRPLNESLDRPKPKISWNLSRGKASSGPHTAVRPVRWVSCELPWPRASQLARNPDRVMIAIAVTDRDRDHDPVRVPRQLAGPRPGQLAADPPHRPDRRMGPAAGLPARQVPGDLRFGPVQRLVQRPAHRQQLARLLPGTRPVRGGRMRDHADFPARAGLLPAPRSAARAGPVPGDLLPDRLVHRSRIHRPLAIPARTHPGRLTSRPARRDQEPRLELSLRAMRYHKM